MTYQADFERERERWAPTLRYTDTQWRAFVRYYWIIMAAKWHKQNKTR